MNKTFVIQWRSKTNGRMGKGSALFDREQAEQLAGELNRDYPEIEHEPIDTQATLEQELAVQNPG